MEEIATYNVKSNILTVEAEDSIQSNGIFAELKQHCILLLDLLQNPNRNNDFISQLLNLLQGATPLSLQPFFDYALFPLLLLFDEAVNCRSSKNFKSKERSVEFSTSETRHKVSDTVAEGVLLCLEEVLKKCRLGSVDQMLVILKKLTYGALLSPLEASEEFREGVIRCFKALLLNLCPCSDESCQCKQIGDSPILQQFTIARVSKHNLVQDECLLAFLQSEPASAAIGHWLSLLLKAADIEATRGQRGSSKLRVEALITLRVLVAKVGTADALAFYLPGVVSQIGKVLHVSRTMISGAAGSAKALDQSLRVLAEYLSIVLEDSDSETNLEVASEKSNGEPLASFLEELRNLPVKNQEKEDDVKDSNESLKMVSNMTNGDKTRVNSDVKVGSLRVERTTDWFAKTAPHVNKLLSATFPNLCVHSSKQVKLALVAAIQAVLCKCSYTLRESRLMLLECLFVLVCDDSDEVSSNAQACFGLLVSSKGNHLIEHDMADVFTRLVEKLPQVVLRNDEALALSHARKLLAVTYFCSPRIIADNLLRSHVAAVSFLDVFTLCLSQNSVYSGSLNKLASKSISSTGFLSSVFEIKAITSSSLQDTDFSRFQNRKESRPYEHVPNEFELPSMPPWFVYVGNQKLYQALAGILRLVSLYVFTDSRSEGYLSVLIDVLLGHFRKLTSDLRTKEYHNDSWQTWYNRNGSGQLVRQACTAACILNEMVFGLSDQSIATFSRMFQSHQGQNGNKLSFGYKDALTELQNQKNRRARNHLIDFIGSILHEYISPEIWDLPLGFSASLQQSEADGHISLHSFTDNKMLHQVIIEGIGVFNICLGKQFSSCGFLHSSLYILLENVICSNFQVRKASDVVLHAISATQGYPTVGHLVLANSDYVIDSICRQLRHLSLNPHVPNVLSAMLSYIGVAGKILPLLEEPMRAVSVELEILGRRQHPHLTVSFLKAVAEIAKASKREACKLPDQAESYKRDVNLKMLNMEKRAGKHFNGFKSNAETTMDLEDTESETDGEISLHEADSLEEEWESVLFKLKDSRRFRRIVGSIAGSCLVAVTPLIASDDPEACLAALDVVEDGIIVLAKVEEAYKHETETRETIRQVMESCSFYNLQDSLDTAEDETGENRMLPAMNKIWPFLVSCFRNKNLLAIRRCCKTIANVVQICGGEFFSRRFQTDGTHFWKLLTTSPFQKSLKKEKTPLQLPYRRNSSSSEEQVAEISNLKVQSAILNMISDLASSKRSATALDAVFKKVSGMVVGIACSGIKGLQESSENALVGLASVDPDLIWLLLADVYYSRKKGHPFPPSTEFPEVSGILPPPLSGKEYLYVLYGGQSYGFDIDFSSVESVFKKLHGTVFASQMYV